MTLEEKYGFQLRAFIDKSRRRIKPIEIAEWIWLRVGSNRKRALQVLKAAKAGSRAKASLERLLKGM
jgi:hypothetical protein